MNTGPWSAREIAVLQPHADRCDMMPAHSYKELGLQLGRSPLAIQKRLSRMRPAGMPMVFNTWTPEQIAVLMPYVLSGQRMSDALKDDLATQFGRTTEAVSQRVHKLRLLHAIPTDADPGPRPNPDAVHKPCRLCRKPFKAATKFVWWCNPCRPNHMARDVGVGR